MIYNPIRLELKKAKDKSKNSSLESLREQSNVGVLNKSHKVQRVTNSIDKVYNDFASICMKVNRAEDQRNARRAKR